MTDVTVSQLAITVRAPFNNTVAPLPYVIFKRSDNLSEQNWFMPALENAHALIVGIANYQKINPLPATVLKDAQDIYNLLVSPNYGGYVPDNVQLLLDIPLLSEKES